MGRKHHGQELWDSLVERVEADDGLPTSEFGGIWTAEKLFFLCCYLEQTTRGISGNKSFPNGLTYLDLFCGTGICRVRLERGTERRFPGSALIAALTPKPFDRLILVDKSPVAVAAVRTRIENAGYRGTVHALDGDVNEVVDRIPPLIPQGTLCVAFIDPYSLDVHYATIAKLAQTRALDLIILFSDAVDVVRNVEKDYYPRQSDKLDLFLGDGSDWRSRWDALHNRDGSSVRQLFADVYCQQLRRLGYEHHGTWPLEGPTGPLFRLVFASKHPLGLKYCEAAKRLKFGGDRGLFSGM